MKHLLPNVPQYYKANFHNHTTVSDGELTPEESRDAYKALGYSILAHTDHSVMVSHQDLNQEDFLMLTGVELDMEEEKTPGQEFRNRKRHLCLLSKDPYMQWVPFRDPNPIPASVPYEACNEIGDLSRAYCVEDMNAVIAECNRHGCLVIYNHPAWSLESYPEYSRIEGIWGVEYRNTGCVGHGYDENNGHIYQDLLKLGHSPMPVMADDTHKVMHGSMQILGGSWNMVGARELTYESVMEALERGDLYASCGPQIHSLTLDGSTLRLTCSSAVQVMLISHTRWCRSVYSKNADLQEAVFDLSPFFRHYGNQPDSFLRLIVTDENGSYAVTRAYRHNELTES